MNAFCFHDWLDLTYARYTWNYIIFKRIAHLFIKTCTSFIPYYSNATYVKTVNGKEWYITFVQCVYSTSIVYNNKYGNLFYSFFLISPSRRSKSSSDTDCDMIGIFKVFTFKYSWWRIRCRIRSNQSKSNISAPTYLMGNSQVTSAWIMTTIDNTNFLHMVKTMELSKWNRKQFTFLYAVIILLDNMPIAWQNITQFDNMLNCL